MRLNFELGVEIFDQGLNQQLATYIEDKVQNASRLSESQLQTISLPSRVRNAIAWLFSPYL